MYIRQLARNAALITAAVILTAGFSTGIAQATNAAPASTVSTVTPGGSTTSRMPPSCTPQPQFCSYDSSIRGLVLVQKFGCANDVGHTGKSPVYQLFNGCGVAVYYYYGTNGIGCMRPHSTRAPVPSNIDYYFVADNPECHAS
jgi:hypothetical protein